MKRLVISIIMGLLVFGSAQGWAAETDITGCLKHNGKLTKFKLGENPKKPCKKKETQVTWGANAMDTPGTGAPRLILRDCGNLDCGRSPQEVGTVLSALRTDKVLIRVPFQGQGGQTFQVGLRAFPNFLIHDVGERNDDTGFAFGVFFSGTNCTGQAWLQSAFETVFQPAFDQAVMIFDDFSSILVPLELYVATSTVASEQTVASSKFESSGCTNAAQSLSVVPAELVDANLADTFPPPYTLEVQ